MTRDERIPKRGGPVAVNVRGQAGRPVQVSDDLWLVDKAQVRIELPEDGLTVDLALRLFRNTMEVDAMQLLRHVGGPPITPTLLRRLDLGRILEELVVPYIALTAKAEATRIPLEGWHTTPDVSAAVSQRKRRDITPELLAEVARHWAEAPTPKHEYIAEQMFTSPRNATRWIALAREAGLLEEEVAR